jgi:hypothetical protein
MKTYPFSYRLFFTFAALLIVTLPACDSSDPEDDAPDVIPSEVFSLPVDLFSLTASNKTGAPKINFTAAALRVWPVSLIVSANLIIPFIAISTALETEPVFQDGAWQWTFTVNADDQSVGFVLSGLPGNGGTDWSMKITTMDPASQNELVDFELFTGHTSDNGRVGSWQLFYYLNETSVNVLNAEYVITGDTERSITFSIPESATLNAGDSVRYEEIGDTRIFEWQQVAESLLHTVTWDALTKEGSILATNFNNGDAGCWDAAFEDAPCAGS